MKQVGTELISGVNNDLILQQLLSKYFDNWGLGFKYYLVMQFKIKQMMYMSWQKNVQGEENVL